MSVSAVTPRPAASNPIRLWMIVAAATALAGLITTVIMFSPSSHMPEPGPASARPASVHSGYFAGPAAHVPMPRSNQAVARQERSAAVSHPRP